MEDVEVDDDCGCVVVSKRGVCSLVASFSCCWERKDEVIMVGRFGVCCYAAMVVWDIQ